jgi:hypothetical protein
MEKFIWAQKFPRIIRHNVHTFYILSYIFVYGILMFILIYKIKLYIFHKYITKNNNH